MSIIGSKLILESKKANKKIGPANITNKRSLFPLVIATSIDALVIGITLTFINSSIFTDIMMIGVITFLVSFIGYHAGNKLKKLGKNNVKIVGGLILITIGAKILIQHLFFGG